MRKIRERQEREKREIIQKIYNADLNTQSKDANLDQGSADFYILKKKKGQVMGESSKQTTIGPKRIGDQSSSEDEEVEDGIFSEDEVEEAGSEIEHEDFEDYILYNNDPGTEYHKEARESFLRQWATKQQTPGY